MSYHIVTIDSPQCHLTYEQGWLICDAEDGLVRKLPVEDIGAIVVTSFAATLHSRLIVEAGKLGIALVLCENFKPASLLLPACRSTDTLLTKAWMQAPPKIREGLWRKTIDAKCSNQLTLAKHIGVGHRRIPDLEIAAKRTPAHKESVCARYYWEIYAAALPEFRFQRNPEDDGTNALLNYGYAVLLSTVLQKCFAYGLDPTFGIGHEVRERSTPLAYDLMEPFRPCVDLRVYRWLTGPGKDQPTTVTKEYRRWVTGFVLEKVGYFDLEVDVRGAVEGAVQSFRRALLSQKLGDYRPWTASTTKWAGCS